MLLPKIFVMAISELPVTLAVILTDNSGNDVPKAITVKPMARSEICSLFAKEEPPSTRKSAPLITRRKPIINSKTDKIFSSYLPKENSYLFNNLNMACHPE